MLPCYGDKGISSFLQFARNSRNNFQSMDEFYYNNLIISILNQLKKSSKKNTVKVVSESIDVNLKTLYSIRSYGQRASKELFEIFARKFPEESKLALEEKPATNNRNAKDGLIEELTAQLSYMRGEVEYYKSQNEFLRNGLRNLEDLLKGKIPPGDLKKLIKGIEE